MLASLITSWLTPTSLFVLLNIVIGTIALTSLLGSHTKPPPPQPPLDDQHHDGISHQLFRAPSLLDRVKSINFSRYKFGHENDHHPQPAGSEYANPDHQPKLARTPSLLDRLKSIDFSAYKFEYSNEETEHRLHEPERLSSEIQPPPLARAPSQLGGLKWSDFSAYKFDNSNAESEHPLHDHDSEPELNRENRPKLAKAPSILERLKSINLSHLYRSESLQSDTDPDPINVTPYSVKNHEHLVKRSKSETPRKEAPTRLAPEKMKKSVSEKSTMNAETTALGYDEEVDAKADDFINRFKQQLRLQRINSLLQYKDMLKGK